MDYNKILADLTNVETASKNLLERYSYHARAEEILGDQLGNIANIKAMVQRWQAFDGVAPELQAVYEGLAEKEIAIFLKSAKRINSTIPQVLELEKELT